MMPENAENLWVQKLQKHIATQKVIEKQEGIGLAIRKAGLHKRGLIQSATVRAPASQLAPDTRVELDTIIKRVGLN